MASVLVAVSALTKYFGMSLLPLLLVYGLLRERRLGTWALWLGVPVVALGGYQWLTHAMYGRGLLLDAAAYATRVGGAAPTSTLERALDRPDLHGRLLPLGALLRATDLVALGGAGGGGALRRLGGRAAGDGSDRTDADHGR